MRKIIVATAVGILVGLAAGWAFHWPDGADPQVDASAAAQAAPASAKAPSFGSVTLTRDDAERMGLALETLKPAWHAPQVQTTAVVLSPSSMAQLTAAYVTDRRDLAVATANLAVARNEYQRQNALYRADQTTSLKALQAARGTLEASQAQITAARRQLQLDTAALEQQWGPVVREWLVAGSPTLEEILGQQAWLVNVTIASSEAPNAPAAIRLLAPSGAAVSGRFVSAFPQVNPVVQGLNYMYLIPARAGFAPNLSLVAELPVGRARKGVVIPAAAVVWSAGQAWAYKQTAPNRFQRLLVSTDEPAAGGWFVATGFEAGERIVTRGAEELFSAETQPASGGGGDEDEGDDD